MNVEWVTVGVAVLTAVLAFAAAIFGAKLTARVSLAQQRQDAEIERQRREDEARRRREDQLEAQRSANAAARNEAKIAARIVRVDVEQARARMSLAVTNGHYWSRAYTLPQDSWIAYREKIAQHLPSSQWTTVSGFFRSAANFEAGAEVARHGTAGNSQAELSDRMNRAMRRAVARADAAIEVLANFTEEDSTPDPEEAAADADNHETGTGHESGSARVDEDAI